MKRYRNYRAKKLRLPRKIVFFTVVALLIILFTVILGNVLKGKLENAEIDKTDILTEDKDNETDKVPDTEEEKSVPHDDSLRSVLANAVELSNETEDSEIYSGLYDIKSAGFNAISFSAYDSEGMLRYASPAVAEMTHMSPSESLISYDTLSAVFSQAHQMGLEVSVVFNVQNSIADMAVAKELFSLGADELILLGFEEHLQLDNEKVSQINGYVDRLRENAGEDSVIGICFDKEFFKTPSNAPYIEKIYTKANFLAIDFTDISADSASEAVQELQGSFSAYLMRPLLDGSDEEQVGAVLEALKGALVESGQIITHPEKTDE